MVVSPIVKPQTAPGVGRSASTTARCPDHAGALARAFPGIDVRALPWIAGYTLEVEEIDATKPFFDRRGVTFEDPKDRVIVHPKRSAASLP